MADLATTFISVANIAAIRVAGPLAAMDAAEATAIHEPLTRILERGGEMSERMAKLVDPLTLLVALGMWGVKIAAVRALTAPERAAVEQSVAVPVASAPGTTNGYDISGAAAFEQYTTLSAT